MTDPETTAREIVQGWLAEFTADQPVSEDATALLVEMIAAALRAAYHEGHDADVERCVAEERAGWDALVAERDEEIARLRGEEAAIRDQAVDRWLDECEATARRYGIEPRQDECITVTLCEEVKRLRGEVGKQDQEIQHLKEALALSLADALDDEQLHALQRQREQPWIKRWRQATGKHDSLPDYGGMLAWIVERADAAEAKLARVEGEARTFFDWADERIKHGMIFPEEVAVRLDPLRAALAGPEPGAGEETHDG